MRKRVLWELCVLRAARAASQLCSLLQVFSRGELELIADLCVKHDALCISDEVYEWLVYDGKEHIRIGMENSMADPGLLLWVQHLWAAPSKEGTGNITWSSGNCKDCLHVLQFQLPQQGLNWSFDSQKQ